jgi:acetyl-CoA C-acetyltransferase
MMRKVSIIGVGTTPFGRLDGRSPKELAVAACREALRDAGVDRREIQAFYLGNFVSGQLTGQELLAPLVANALGLPNIPCTKVEGACASGGIALRHAYLLVATGVCDVALAAGVEKLTGGSTERVTAAMASAADLEVEAGCGLTVPGAWGLIMRRHMLEFGTTREQVALVAVKNHANGSRNPMAQAGNPVTLERVLESPLVADPIRRYDCCPISDGAAAAVLCAADRSATRSPLVIDILAAVQAIGPSALVEMSSLTSFEATVRAAREAYAAAGITAGDVDVVELHDCFSMAEIVDSEDLGLFPKGKGGPAVADGETQVDGRIPINPSGGLLAKGHPVGATGLGQVYELVQQLRGGHPNQVKDAEIGLAHNLGGTGAVGTVTILRRRG